MSDFIKNTIIVFVAAALAFLFSYILELIKRAVDRKHYVNKTRSLALLSLKATQKVLDSIKSKYQDNDYFDFIYLDQLTELARQQDKLRFGEAFFERKVDQSTYFNLVSRFYLLAANMRSIEQFKNNKEIQLDDKTKASFVAKKQNEFIIEATEVSSKVDDIVNILDE